MSAFVVEDKTINCIVNHLVFHRDDYGYEWRELAKLGIDLGTDNGDLDLSRRIAELNDRGVDARYKPGTATSDRPEPFKPHLFEKASIYQVYKSLQCWLYQCSEGDVPEDALYKLFETEIKPAIAEAIISSLPEYKAAKWG